MGAGLAITQFLGHLFPDDLGERASCGLRGDTIPHRDDWTERPYRKAIEIDPKNASPWIGLGNLPQEHLDGCQEAEAAYRQSVVLDPQADLARLLAACGGKGDADGRYRRVAGLAGDGAGVGFTELVLQPRNGGWTAARVRSPWWLARHNEAE